MDKELSGMVEEPSLTVKELSLECTYCHSFMVVKSIMRTRMLRLRVLSWRARTCTQSVKQRRERWSIVVGIPLGRRKATLVD